MEHKEWTYEAIKDLNGKILARVVKDSSGWSLLDYGACLAKVGFKTREEAKGWYYNKQIKPTQGIL